MKMSKVIRSGLVLLLALMMVMSLFVGCSGNNNDEQNNQDQNNQKQNNQQDKSDDKNDNNEKSNDKENNANDEKEEKEDNETSEDLGIVASEPTTFTMLYSDNASYQYKEDWVILSEITKATNVTLELQPVPESDYATKRQIIINSGDMPDIISKTSAANVSEYALNGVFLPISQYLDQLPNLSQVIEKYGYEKDLNNIRESDGEFYQLPVRAHPFRLNTHIWLARVDLIEDLGFDLPETMDDLYEIGVALKEEYPESTPITNRFGSANILSMMAPAFGTKAGWELGNSGFMLDEENDEWIFAPSSDEYKDMLMYMNKLLEAGVLDKEFATLDSNVYEQRVINSSNFLLADWVGNEIRYNKAGQELDPDFNVQPIFPPKGDGGYALGTGSMFQQGWVIPMEVKEKDNFDVFMRFLDWFYTEEASLITSFGLEGTSYELVDGKPKYMDEILNGEVDASKAYGVDNNVLSVLEHTELFGSRKTPEIVKLYEDMTDAGCIEAKQPGLKLDADQKELEKLYSSALKDYYSSMTEKFIFGKETFDNWDNFVDECEKKGAEALRKLYNDVWENQK